MQDIREVMTMEERHDFVDKLHGTDFIESAMRQVHQLFKWGRIVDSPTIEKLNEDLWIALAEKRGFKWGTDKLISKK